MREIGKVGVLGAGTMGHGIAQVLAMSGIETRLYDVDAHEWFFIPEPVRRRLLGV